MICRTVDHAAPSTGPRLPRAEGVPPPGSRGGPSRAASSARMAGDEPVGEFGVGAAQDQPSPGRQVHRAGQRDAERRPASVQRRRTSRVPGAARLGQQGHAVACRARDRPRAARPPRPRTAPGSRGRRRRTRGRPGARAHGPVRPRSRGSPRSSRPSTTTAAPMPISAETCTKSCGVPSPRQSSARPPKLASLSTVSGSSGSGSGRPSGRVVPAEVRGADHRVWRRRHQTRHGHGEARARTALPAASASTSAHQRGELPPSTAAGGRPAVGAVPHGAAHAGSPRRSTAHTARWSTPISAPIPAGPRSLSARRRARAADPPPGARGPAPQQSRADQFVDQGGDGRPGQADVRRRRRRGRAAPRARDGVHDPGEVAAAHALLRWRAGDGPGRPRAPVQRCGSRPSGCRRLRSSLVGCRSRFLAPAAAPRRRVPRRSGPASSSSRSTASSTGPRAVSQRRATAAGPSPVSSAGGLRRGAERDQLPGLGHLHRPPGQPAYGLLPGRAPRPAADQQQRRASGSASASSTRSRAPSSEWTAPS